MTHTCDAPGCPQRVSPPCGCKEGAQESNQKGQVGLATVKKGSGITGQAVTGFLEEPGLVV